jgi:hypothetical protein
MVRQAFTPPASFSLPPGSRKFSKYGGIRELLDGGVGDRHADLLRISK